MRLNPLMLGLTLIVGVAGVVLTTRAFIAYHDASEAFTQADLGYVSGSFAWQDEQFEHGTALFEVVNDSDYTVTLESFRITLTFDGEFAGSDYAPWQPVEIPSGEEREIPVNFTVTANSIQHLGGTAELGYAGQLRLTFAELEEPLAFRFRGGIGVTPYAQE